ncbi:MAG: cyclodeaminase/cyclohydrolase family protein [Planctomycetota bacterium]|nr:cyclodeaminase/cyclohydrolase family protein [Planctomycetota bacterium]MDA1105786.1 cyclodeaminase/cyclohydrolase family protein [Planctomycetota bacterium]
MSDPGARPPAADSVAEYLAALASKTPAPGGGAAAAITLAQAAALAGMVLEYTVGKTKFLEHEAANRARLLDATRIREAALRLAHDDAIAYQSLNALQRQPGVDAEALAVATARAISVPHDVVTLSALLLAALSEYPGVTTRMLVSDVRVATILAHAALQAGLANVEVNLLAIPDGEREVLRQRLGLAGLADSAAKFLQRVESACC